MKKSVIALAIAAAMPAAAMADITMTGSVTAKYYLSAETTISNPINNRTKGGLDVDADLDLESTEVLANGMTAHASFDVSDHGNSKGKASLEGDFGKLTVGSSLDADGAYQMADIAAVVSDATDAPASPDGDEDASTANAIHYGKDFELFNLEFQRNASTNSIGTTGAQTENTQLGVSMDVTNEVAVAYGYSKNKNASDAASVIGVTYNANNIEVTYGQGSKHDGTDIDGILGIGYTMNEFKVKYTHDTAKDVDGSGNTSGSGKDTLELTYTGGNGVTAALEYDQDEDADNESTLGLKVTYVQGDWTMVTERKQDKSTDATLSYDMGNADLEVMRDGSKKNSTLQYKVSF